ncbi:DUF3397 domain-containing protein [Paenisporosarcina sp. FSL H8-0542]|uniref:DUF3397 domain-containing protein n=1 Tax=unclassified Paenisporosarcina TaxID=2642018 RepID=UPI00034E005B|nr:DUF3397 domain-containing protein [Paenisporosarcina sp. HGH0030]EPD52890.1 hypothetical protein HMPREF1210_01270 [Paenisporosarcina sp. HGH0030]
MTNIIQAMVSFLIVMPLFMFIVVYIISLKLTKKMSRAFGHAADITTFLLFMSIPVALKSLFHIETMGIIVGLALITSVLLTILEWKSKKEIELLTLLRKIWRILFLVLSFSYFIIWCGGLVIKVIEYMN